MKSPKTRDKEGNAIAASKCSFKSIIQ